MCSESKYPQTKIKLKKLSIQPWQVAKHNIHYESYAMNKYATRYVIMWEVQPGRFVGRDPQRGRGAQCISH